MGWAVLFLVPVALIIILAAALINRQIQIHKVITQLQAILDGKTKKMVTVSLNNKRLEYLAEMINQIALADHVHLEEIRKREDELKENISCLSHDLRTPLTSFRGYLQLLSEASDDKKAEYIRTLTGKAVRLERLIDDFYQISLLEAGQYPFFYERVELGSLLTEIILDNHSVFREKGIEPQVKIPPEKITVLADKTACTRVIQNLLFNAANGTAESIWIGLIYREDRIWLWVKNPITDVPTEEAARLLERFYVADVSRSKGTSGQGLYIVKKLLFWMNCEEPTIKLENHTFEIVVDFSPLLIKP